MKKLIIALFLLTWFGIQSGCVVPMSPVTADDRVVTAGKDESKFLTVIDGIVMTDMLGSRGIRFPGGTYLYEAEDDVYRYFAAPSALEYRVFREGKPVDGRFIPGGIALAKQTLRMVPAAGYMNDGEGKKTITWKLGAEFLRTEGKRWSKSF